MKTHSQRVMTAPQFNAWMRAASRMGLASSTAQFGALIGKTDDTILAYTRKGADYTVALACAAVVNGVKPWGEK